MARRRSTLVTPTQPMSSGWMLYFSLIALIMLIAASSTYAHSQRMTDLGQLVQQWDTYPDVVAMEVNPGQVEMASPQLTAADYTWPTCSSSSCAAAPITHYPTLYPTRSLNFIDGCATVKPSNLAEVASIDTASSEGDGLYTVSLSSGRGSITICQYVGTPDRSNDVIAIWNDRLPAGPLY
ncbi:MAG TPA: hypothetical protein VLI05_01460 [Candidatus Saccharimonadia bacterium]|nr:hypothetical protein [Candidatus Saccharimonadia bacterium]